MLRLILVRAGFEVIEAEDGYRALEEVERQLPDLMLLDVMMPGIDGFEVCKNLRAQKSTSGLPIIMLSAKTDALSVQRGLQLGANKYLTKPVSPEELTRHVHETLSVENEVPSD
jgi:two-component system alkaline phosphatase synthesis response regulator PhoP